MKKGNYNYIIGKSRQTGKTYARNLLIQHMTRYTTNQNGESVFKSVNTPPPRVGISLTDEQRIAYAKIIEEMRSHNLEYNELKFCNGEMQCRVYDVKCRGGGIWHRSNDLIRVINRVEVSDYEISILRELYNQLFKPRL